MLYTPHFLTGALIMKYTQSPLIGIAGAFLSHFALDMMPHNDFGLTPGITLKEFMKMERKRRNLIILAMGTDYFLWVISFIWIFFTFKNWWLILAGMAGVLPDLAEQFLMLFGLALPGWQDKLQFRVSAKYGFIYYPVITGLAIYLLLH
ncbi:hypothetical protein A3D78_04290 [Candidatus Gottesmanbacteria bacterium RIFCSPHIGHO2_02_FULL_39_14]|uniref:Uncharacterized protein n=3 Tax=Candidatus Gottesmaniibacteriota TaxID=1752720 RepID=A0A1F5ZU00_9BACT|nr:MAG: hypothetical protein A2153_00390 [Candidatus Gottesmanbacteria bacterium RBG_16_38_7b]OGG15814.1 MAG: hypothetical protein A3D78_04290 [Candidatus Gottesmanbacteria bacterium RIFCSPHIGHO2_02_FULL_39_14]OGG32359.1 MAG: hypothetical protein A3I51_01645 [Candidatus Gottesmanbacteria bacterium RIFCSPLOWO2_02_FULL_38_8]